VIDLEIDKPCALCGQRTPNRFVHTRVKPPGVYHHALDGRPLDLSLAAHRTVDECAHCGHVAPVLGLAYPKLAEVAEARAEFASQHAPWAAKMLSVAHLFNGVDPREEGFYVLRAAWEDEALGRDARALRRRSALLLEEALFQGLALDLEPGGSCILLAELFRTSGDFQRAADHAARGLRLRWALDEGRWFLFECAAITSRDLVPGTRLDARRFGSTTAEAERDSIIAPYRARLAALPPIRITEHRWFRPPHLHGGWSRHAERFAAEYVDPAVAHQLLSASRLPTVAHAARAFRSVFVALLRAAGDADPLVRGNAALVLRDVDFDRVPWCSDLVPASGDPGHDIDAAAGVLFDSLANDDTTMVCNVAQATQKLLRKMPNLRGAALPKLRAALPRVAGVDLSAEGAIERAIEQCTGP
jgi:hypothetical protein